MTKYHIKTNDEMVVLTADAADIDADNLLIFLDNKHIATFKEWNYFVVEDGKKELSTKPKKA
jgi:hypothetical protein